MNKLKTKKSLSFPTWPYLATPIIVTLYFNIAAADPFNTPKFMLLLIFTTYMLSYVLLQARNLTFNLKDSQVRIYLLISIFLLFLLIATFNTDQRFVGLFGESQRRNGFLTYLMLSILLIYATLVANIISAKKLINVVILVALIQGLYGLLQSMGRDFVNWNNPYNPVITTMGNPNYASAVLAVFAVLSSLLLFVKPLSIIMKLILVVTTFVSMYVVISSDSRQGLILFAISILFYTTIYISRQYKKYRPWAILTFFTFISFGILAMLQIGPLTQFIYKQSVSVRGYYWRAGISMFLDKPFFGVGVDRYGSYFKEYRELEYPLKYGFDITSTDAHNNFIQMFATGGVFVGLLYMFITLYVFYAGMKLIFDKKNENFQLCLIIFSAWLGLLAQSVVSINNLGTSVWSWTIGGLIIGLERYQSNHHSIDTSSQRKKLATGKITLFQPVLAIVLLIPVSFVVVFLNRAEENAYSIRNFQGILQSDPNRLIAKDYAEKVINNPFSDPINKIIASEVLISAGFPEDGLNQLNYIIQKDSRNYDAQELLAQARKFENRITEAIIIRERISRIDPWGAPNLLLLIELYKIDNKMDKARLVYNKLLKIAPNSEEAKKAKQLLELIN